MNRNAGGFTVALVVLGAGCGSGSFTTGSPLSGTWQAAVNNVVFAGTVVVTLADDGSFTEDLTATKVLGVSCSGTETTTGLTWSSTGTTLTVGGQAGCSGSYTCGSTTQACSTSMGLAAGTCTYALTNGNNTLTLSGCTTAAADITLTRM
jgi:hypothetical protein